MQTKRLVGVMTLGLGLTLGLLLVLAIETTPLTARAWPITPMPSPTPPGIRPPGPAFVKPGGTGGWCLQNAPCGSIQYAIDQCTPGNGDTIYVAGGVYTGTDTQVIHVTQNITLYGGWDGLTGTLVVDPAAYPTILDGENARRVVLISLPLSPTLAGLTLQRGNAAGLDGDPAIPGADAGGAVYAKNASPTISNCHILSSTAGFGAGLALYGGAPLVMNSVIADNVAIQSMSGITRGAGGGMLLYQTAGVVAGNLIAHNVASGTQTYDGGGGLYLDGSTTLVRDNTIQGNRGPHSGGGMVIYGSAAIVRGNVILNNTGGVGGAVLLISSPTHFEANTVIGNGSTAMGGGFAVFDSVNFTLTNNVIAQNHGAYPAGLFAGALFDGSSSQGVLIHNTFADNPSGGSNPWTIHLGTGPFRTATLVLTNNIVGLPGGVFVDTGSTAVLDTTLWDRIPIGIETGGPGTIHTNTNLHGDAGFVGPYRLGPGSPAIDQGANAGIASDIDGEARPNGPKPDIGADEFYCYALSGVTIAGPADGISGTAHTFTATASPPTATLPITYTWQATDHTPIITAVYGLSHTATFIWTGFSTKTITVTVANYCGGAVNTHTVAIRPPEWSIYLPLVLKNSP